MFNRLTHLIFIRSWWVIAFILACAIFYEHNLEKESISINNSQKKTLLEAEKLYALKHQQNLQRQINSQSDLTWIELTLMKGLGMVPEGQQKVYFQP